MNPELQHIVAMFTAGVLRGLAGDQAWPSRRRDHAVHLADYLEHGPTAWIAGDVEAAALLVRISEELNADQASADVSVN